MFLDRPIVFDLRSIVRKYWKNHIGVINEALKCCHFYVKIIHTRSRILPGMILTENQSCVLPRRVSDGQVSINRYDGISWLGYIASRYNAARLVFVREANPSIIDYRRGPSPIISDFQETFRIPSTSKIQNPFVTNSAFYPFHIVLYSPVLIYRTSSQRVF
jgi:hypothetical protein